MASSGPVSSAADPESPRNPLYEEDAMPQLAVGDTAPDFTLPDAAGADVSLTTLRRGAEHGVVVYFYPIFAQFCAVHIGSIGGSRVFDEYPVVGLGGGEVFPGCALGFQHNIGLGGTPRHEGATAWQGQDAAAMPPPHDGDGS